MPPFPRQQLLSLYSQYMRTSNSFASYNFKEYFLRRSRHKFRTELPQLLGLTSAAAKQPLLDFDESSLRADAEDRIQDKSSSQSSSSSTPVAALDDANHTKVVAWMKEAQQELEGLQRAAVTNSMYKAPSLVVEGRGRLMADTELEQQEEPKESI